MGTISKILEGSYLGGNDSGDLIEVTLVIVADRKNADFVLIFLTKQPLVVIRVVSVNS
jgi:hypothetical protein